MRSMNFKKKWVLVTGASSGLGYEMAIQFAKEHKANVILVARRHEKLIELQQKIIKDYAVECQVICADLTIEEDVKRIFTESTQKVEVYAVILNAGVTYFGKQKELEWDYFEKVMNTNVKSVVQLTNLFSEYLIKKNNKGGIMYVASMAGLTPTPYQSVYAGTKAFVVNFGLSMQGELHGKPVSLSVYAPGGIDTEFTQNTGLDYFNKSGLIQDAEECAQDGIHAFKHRKSLYVPRLMNQTQIFFSKIIPKKIVTTLTARTFKMALKNINKP